MLTKNGYMAFFFFNKGDIFTSLLSDDTLRSKIGLLVKKLHKFTRNLVLRTGDTLNGYL